MLFSERALHKEKSNENVDDTKRHKVIHYRNNRSTNPRFPATTAAFSELKNDSQPFSTEGGLPLRPRRELFFSCNAFDVAGGQLQLWGGASNEASQDQRHSFFGSRIRTSQEDAGALEI